MMKTKKVVFTTKVPKLFLIYLLISCLKISGVKGKVSYFLLSFHTSPIGQKVLKLCYILQESRF